MRLILILVLTCYSFVAVSQKIKNDLSYSIVFASCFRNDSVSLKLNDKAVIDAQTVRSDSITGVTPLTIYQDSERAWITNQGTKYQFPFLVVKDAISLEVMVNGKWTAFKVNLRRGRIIFIDNCFVNESGASKRKLTIKQYRKTVTLE